MSNSFRGPECGVPQRPIGQAAARARWGFTYRGGVLGNQPIAALGQRADTAQLCQPRTMSPSTGLAQLRGIGPSAEGGDWLTPKYSTH